MQQELQDSALLTTLNGWIPEGFTTYRFVEDTENVNAGYPILDWQASGGDEGDEEDEGEGDSEEEEWCTFLLRTLLAQDCKLP
ncbi:hypothetical protein FACS1894198_5710 [Clostridia bacterium]|nr:hypothetical protein FACS1894198_5710 [Clostridia bacterium]